MKYFEEMSHLEEDVDLAIAELKMSPDDPLIVGEFEDKKLPSYREVKRKILEAALGDSR